MSFPDPIMTIKRGSPGRERTLRVYPWHILGAAIGIGVIHAAIAVFGLVLPVDLGAFEAPRDRIERRIRVLDEALRAMETEGEILRSRAGLPPVDEDVRKLGVGGTSLAPVADPLEEKLHRLNLECELQAASLREIVDRLRARRELWERIPLIAPISSGYLSSRFGPRLDPFTKRVEMHQGLDMRADTGSPVYASASGIVRAAGRQSGYGLVVIIDHENGLESRYAHAGSLNVREGDTVRRGQLIARVGSSGRVTAPHLHYEVRQFGQPLDPVRFLAADLAELE